MTNAAASWPETLDLVPVRARQTFVDQPVLPANDGPEAIDRERLEAPPRKKRHRRRGGGRRVRRPARANADQPAVVCIAITAVCLVGGLALFLM